MTLQLRRSPVLEGAQCKHMLAVMNQVTEKEAAASGRPILTPTEVDVMNQVTEKEAAALGVIPEPVEPAGRAEQSGVHLRPVDGGRPDAARGANPPVR